MSIMELDSYLTAKALLNRRVLLIKCCGEPMCRRDVTSHMPEGNRFYGVSEVELVCGVCGKLIQVDLEIGFSKAGDIWEVLEPRAFPEEYKKKFQYIREEAEKKENDIGEMIVEYNGEKMTLKRCAKKKGMLWQTLKYRILQGWGIERALSEEVKSYKPYKSRKK